MGFEVLARQRQDLVIDGVCRSAIATFLRDRSE